MRMIVKVWCLPKMDEADLNKHHQALVKVAKSMKEFGVESEKDMVVLFPPDMMAYGLGSEIVLEVSTWLRFGLHWDDPEERQRAEDMAVKLVGELGIEMGRVLYEFHPEATILAEMRDINIRGPYFSILLKDSEGEPMGREEIEEVVTHRCRLYFLDSPLGGLGGSYCEVWDTSKEPKNPRELKGLTPLHTVEYTDWDLARTRMFQFRDQLGNPRVGDWDGRGSI